MAGNIHAGAPHHLPPFITEPGATDTLFVVIVVSTLAVILLLGNFYFKLHSLPEKMAHRANSTQLQLVGVLALLAMFTHNNLFWVGALLLAALRMPDYASPLNALVAGVNRLADREAAPEKTATEAPPPPPAPPAAVVASPEPAPTDVEPAPAEPDPVEPAAAGPEKSKE